MEYLITLVIVAIAYLIGSFPTGYILVKLLKGKDIREVGSGSTGATNVKRELGTWSFFVVLTLDALKGMLPVMAAKILEIQYGLFTDLSILPILVALAVILGHSKSAFLNFSGGKSVASGVGTMIGLCPPAGILTVVIFANIAWVSKYISLASIIAVLLAPIWMTILGMPPSYAIFTFVGALYIVYLHRENIERLKNGTENKVR